MSRLPTWVIPAAIVALMLVGLLAPLPFAVPALLVVAAFIGWLGYLSWPVLTPQGRLLRALVVAIVAGAIAARGAGRM
jgi:hypothetical protein